MQQILWLTDVHLNFLAATGAKAFGDVVREENPSADAAVITGDIGECPNFVWLLDQFAEGFGRPVWFVCGNHDAYGGSVAEMREKAAAMKGQARWLTTAGIVEMNERVALIGQDGWYDAQYGEPFISQVEMSDFDAIGEFKEGQRSTRSHARAHCVTVARKLSAEAVVEARGIVEKAVSKGYKTILFATHVPPFEEATWHEGRVSNFHWLPWMSSKGMGSMLSELAGENPDREFVVICGHTHSSGIARIAPNLTVFTGPSEYYKPRVAGTFSFGAEGAFSLEGFPGRHG